MNHLHQHIVPDPKRFTLDLPTTLSLGLVLSFLPIAQLSAWYFLPSSSSRATTKTLYWLFIWCVFDVLTHTIVEGSYLYHCFFSYLDISTNNSVHTDYPHPASLGSRSTATGLHAGPFLGRSDRLYGSFYSDGPMARLWREYAKADKRWGGADVTVISLEILTVFGAGPLALYICTLISRVTNPGASSVSLTPVQQVSKARLEARLWFSGIVLSTAELYGGFITFAPEWLSGSTLLVTDDPVYLWLYLFFFNMLWVVIPFWVLWVSWSELGNGFVRGVVATTTVTKKGL